MPKFLIGDVVAFKTHPFNELTSNVIVSGEYQMIPPLLIITEIAQDLDKGSGAALGPPKYTCLWFSTKNNEFKESYFVEDDLKHIAHKETEGDTVLMNSEVVLKSTFLELNKKRSFLNTETNAFQTKNSNSIIGLLSFVCPVMIVIDIQNYDFEKANKNRGKTNQRKIFPVQIVKCKWFDCSSEKFSEKWIPLDALHCLPTAPLDLIELASSTITSKSFLKFEDTILQPTQISNRSGIYYLTAFDLVLQKNRTVKMDMLSGAVNIVSPYTNFAPHFKRKHKKPHRKLKLVLTVEELFKDQIKGKTRTYITIRYEDQFGTFTTRTVSHYELLTGDSLSDSEVKTTQYVRAMCHLRQEKRNFKLDKIHRAEVLDLVFVD